MAGTDSRFDPTTFRDAIKFVMQMAAPQDTAQQIAFHWKPEKTFAKHDSGGDPFSWDTTPTSTVAPTDLHVDCAVSFAGSKAGGSRTAPTGTPVGEFDMTHGVVTVLDNDWATVLSHGSDTIPDQCVIDGDYFDIVYIAPPTGLFSVTIYDIHIESVDEH